MLNGGVAVLDSSGTTVRSLPAPWAMDTNQKPVAASYSISGSKVTLKVEHSTANAYPVVADPCYSCWYKTAVAVAGGAAVVVGGAIALGATAPAWVGAAAVYAGVYYAGHTASCEVLDAWGRSSRVC
jgi:hypothetical protein